MYTHPVNISGHINTHSGVGEYTITHWERGGGRGRERMRGEERRREGEEKGRRRGEEEGEEKGERGGGGGWGRRERTHQCLLSSSTWVSCPISSSTLSVYISFSCPRDSTCTLREASSVCRSSTVSALAVREAAFCSSSALVSNISSFCCFKSYHNTCTFQFNTDIQYMYVSIHIHAWVHVHTQYAGTCIYI